MRLKPGRPSVDEQPVAFDAPAAMGPMSVTFLGVSTVLVDDGASAVMFDGYFSRPSLLRVALRPLAPDSARISAALERVGHGSGGRPLEAVVPVHTHFDHALDSAEVAARTGARLVGGVSAANVGRGGGLAEDRLHVVEPGEPVTAGRWTLTFAESEHCPPDRFPGTIDEPLGPPAKATAYRCGEAWSVRVRHETGRTALVQGSAGFVPGALEAQEADVAYLGVGQLGLQPEHYLRDYWQHTVRAVGARRVVLTHWDDFFRPLDQPLRALPYAGDDLDVTVRTLVPLAAEDGVAMHFPTAWRREDPWQGIVQDGSGPPPT
jgi:L-ascorbate metabolism protein UlaG (beta-lactamase superfamily)